MINDSKSGIHIIAITETWLDKKIEDAEVDIPGYKIYRKDRDADGGGVAVYVRNDLSVIRREDLEDPNLEGLWLEITLPKSRGFLLGLYYRPPDSSDYLDGDFMARFTDVAELTSSEGKEILLVGDFNCDFSAKRLTSGCKQLKSLFRTLSFIQFIDSPTRITKDTSTLLDLIATNCPQNISKSGVISSGFSDHEMIFFIRKINWKRFPAQMKTFRNYANYESSKFTEDLKGVDWDSVLSPCDASGTPVDNSIDEQWANLKSAFLSTASNHAPLIEKRSRGIDCPWMNGKIKKTIRERDHCLIKARRTNADEHWATYRHLRNLVTRQIRDSKSKYNRRMLEENNNDPKGFWKTIKRILPGEKKSVASSIKVNGKIITENKTIAENFNDYFVGTVKRLVSLMGCSALSTSARKYFFLPCGSTENFKFAKVSEELTLNQLRGLKNGKAVGLDQMPVRLLKYSASVIAKPLTTIINLSLAKGKVPDEWKAARVIPLFKKGKIENLDNYRPISVLSTASKILERAVHCQLYEYLNKHKLLNPFQCGFRRNHSTETAAISFTDSIRRQMDQSCLTGAVFIDLRRAFDAVDHALLLDKLRRYGIMESELAWFRDYLSNRTQIVSYQNKLSSPRTISTGVPQGSILGPLLFVLFINDLPEATAKCSVLLYADDAVLFSSAKDAQTIEQALNYDLSVISDWISQNHLFLNKEKTEVVLFGTSQKLATVEEFRISIGRHQLERVSEFKYLGVVLDETLSWKAHTRYATSKAGKKVGMLGRLRKHLTSYAANSIYQAHILPVLEYCDTVWAGCNKQDSDGLERLQRRAARIVMHSKDSDFSMKTLKWETLLERRQKHILSLVNKCLKKKVPQFLMVFLNSIGKSFHGQPDKLIN